MIISAKRLTETAQLPLRATAGAAGYDLFSDEPAEIPPNECRVVRTGIAVELPAQHEMQIRSRSGLAAKQQVFVLNSPGTIDSDYRGEIKIILFNLGKETQFFPQGSKIAQAIVTTLPEVTYVEDTDLSVTDRGDKGFGHSGV